MKGTNVLLLLFWVIFSTIFAATATDILTSEQSLIANQTLVSNGEVFVLGFFNPENSSKTFLGIWYKKISPRTVVWVANRDKPIYNIYGVYLKLVNNSHLLLANGSGSIWSSAPSETPLNNPIVQLLDSGNLVVREESEGKNYEWQSFDYPTNTLLPGMKLGWDSVTGLNRFIRSWKSPDDPGQGRFSFKLVLNGSPEIYLWNENEIKYRSGPWNGIQWSGVPEMSPNPSGFHFTFVSNQYEKYYSYEVIDKSVVSRLVVHESGKLKRYTWTQNEEGWNIYWASPKDPCDDYKRCGVYGICIEEDSPNCSCVKGFMPKNQKQWSLKNGKDGCVPKKEVECGQDDGFLELKRMKLPDSSSSYVNDGMNLKECKRMCRNNCSCTAYANSNSIRGSGCILWFGELIDLRNYAKDGQNLYVRVAASQLGNYKESVTIIITTIAVAAVFLLGLGVCFMWKKKKMIMERTFKKKKKDKVSKVTSQELPLFDTFLSDQRDHSSEKNNDDLELPLINMEVVISTTDNFSDANKLGQGGFGCVYKGNFSNGQEIAVKRLSKSSGQGVEEFKNEVMLIARLQHRNLVRLLACCVDGEEKILVYEYMPNKSLDFILFDRTRSTLLDWKTRFNIIVGIARGLLYLHQDSRFRIIHRDLKASNVLLDAEMNPKISDFGIARVFGGNQTEANTNRIVGTYGYMSPEYAMDGLFSIKSDVFSYGVLLLEIISGQRNKGFYHSNDEVNLLGHAWKLWEEGKGLELIDSSLGNSFSLREAVRCIQVSLLCVQEYAEERPSMSSVLLMLNSETSILPHPKQPGFSLIKPPVGTSSSSNIQESFTSKPIDSYNARRSLVRVLPNIVLVSSRLSVVYLFS